MAYILTTNTKKLVKVSLEEQEEWMKDREWDDEVRVIAQNTVGYKLITTILQEDTANTPIKPKKLFTTYIDDGDATNDDTKVRHSATIKQAQNHHAKVVLQERAKQ